MKKLLPFLPLLLLLAACSSTAPSPVIQITGLFLNGDEKDYAKELSLMPSLKVGDEVLVSLKLDGSGEELNTFIVQDDDQQLTIEEFELPEVGVSGDKNFTKLDEGIVGFENGVKQTELKVKARVRAVNDEDATLLFYLFSRAECDAAKQEVDMKTEK